MRRLAYVWLDVFAARPLAGNQLVVFPRAGDLDDRLLRAVTRELNHSETVFLQPADGADARARIFIPTSHGADEVPFAGHPLLGAACVIRGSGAVRLQTGVGPIDVEVAPSGEGAFEAHMVQPVPRLVRVVEARAQLAEALGLSPGQLHADLPVEAVDNGMQTVIVPLASLAAVQQARPELAKLRGLLGRDGLCTLVFALGGVEPDSDVHCRVFSPFDFVPEDPATGSANGPLGDYLVRHGALDRTVIRSEQGYEAGRPSRLQIELRREQGVTRAVLVGGRVVRIGSGEFALP